VEIYEDDLPDLKFREVLARHLAHGFESVYQRPVATFLDPWGTFEAFPSLVIHEDLDFGRADAESGPCHDRNNLAALFVAGVPGGDPTVRMGTAWQAFIRDPNVFAGITEDPWWYEGDMIPVIETRGGFRIFDILGVQLIAAQSTIRTEMHHRERGS